MKSLSIINCSINLQLKVKIQVYCIIFTRFVQNQVNLVLFIIRSELDIYI